MSDAAFDLVCADRLEEIGSPAALEVADALRRGHGQPARPRPAERYWREPDRQAIQESYVLIGGANDGRRVNSDRRLVAMPVVREMAIWSTKNIAEDYMQLEEYERHSFTGEGYRFDYFSLRGMDGNDAIHHLLSRYPEPDGYDLRGRSVYREPLGRSYR